MQRSPAAWSGVATMSIAAILHPVLGVSEDGQMCEIGNNAPGFLKIPFPFSVGDIFGPLRSKPD